MITTIVAIVVGLAAGSTSALLVGWVQRRSVEAQIRRSFRVALQRWEDDRPNRDAAAAERLQRIAEDCIARALENDRRTTQMRAVSATDTRQLFISA